MTGPFSQPNGFAAPKGTAAPTPSATPWPSHPDFGPGRSRMVQRRKARRVLRKLHLATGTPLRVVVLLDYSGSMDSFADARESVLAELLPWLQRELVAGDEVAVIAFGGDASSRLDPTPAAELDDLAPPQLTSYATLLGPTWSLLAAFAPTPAETVVIAISDGYVADLTGAGHRTYSVAAGVSREALVIPGTGQVAPPAWRAAFPDSSVTNIDTQDPALIADGLAHVLSDLTGRALTSGTDAAA